MYAAGEMLFIDLSEVTEQAIYTIHDLGERHLLEGTVSGQGLYSRTLVIACRSVCDHTDLGRTAVCAQNILVGLGLIL